MTRTHFVASLGLVLAGALALPLLADEKKEHFMTGEIMIDKPYAEVQRMVDEAIKDAGLICVADIDWARLGAGDMRREPPAGSARLEAGTVNLRTYCCDTDACIKMIGASPVHALKLPGRFIIFEKDGKTCYMATKPYASFKEHESDVPEKIRDLVKDHTKDLEKRLEKVLEKLKS